ncbi:MarR family winged helix-turn-helix transcriptional regulator [Alloalcanivorax gelatiniphagus]|uniref:Winged helix-turn-helix transcriptional regulator n=1 Tax=Alloalcanivorax gelatiniphagus TaxID=1194167 RepID=A0ABY2XHU6_9GAMM|nr:MarR family winged helix-turn-helix transcriptional regulator [Alloalcanivorax gelatiniphagus]TMW10940.1 winged helix-turn-helix transcriptional regulator [Alloalcanivorax gelatiniphagus]
MDASSQPASATSRSSLLDRPGFLIRRLHQIHCSLFLEETRRFNITPVQYSLLTALAERGELDQVGLATEIGLERTSVAEVIQRLEARGLVSRRRSESDRRVKRVRLERKGRALVKRVDEAAQRAHDRTIEALPEPERAALLSQLVRLVEANNDKGQAPFRMP